MDRITNGRIRDAVVRGGVGLAIAVGAVASGDRTSHAVGAALGLIALWPPSRGQGPVRLAVVRTVWAGIVGLLLVAGWVAPRRTTSWYYATVVTTSDAFVDEEVRHYVGLPLWLNTAVIEDIRLRDDQVSYAPWYSLTLLSALPGIIGLAWLARAFGATVSRGALLLLIASGLAAIVDVGELHAPSHLNGPREAQLIFVVTVAWAAIAALTTVFAAWRGAPADADLLLGLGAQLALIYCVWLLAPSSTPGMSRLHDVGAGLPLTAIGAAGAWLMAACWSRTNRAA